MICRRQLRRIFRRAGARAALSCAACDGRFRLTPSFLPPAARAALASFPGALNGLSPAVGYFFSARTDALPMRVLWASLRIVLQAYMVLRELRGSTVKISCWAVKTGRVIPFAKRAAVGRHALPQAPIKFGRVAAERGVAGASGVWGRGRKGTLSANYSILCNFV